MSKKYEYVNILKVIHLIPTFFFLLHFLFLYGNIIKIILGGKIMSDNKGKKEPEEIEIINGDGKDLDISPVYDHIKDTTPQPSSKKPKNIIIPKESHKK